MINSTTGNYTVLSSFRWWHFKILSTDSKVRTTLYSIINSTKYIFFSGVSFQAGRRTQRPVVHTPNNTFFSVWKSFCFAFKSKIELTIFLTYVTHTIEKKKRWLMSPVIYYKIIPIPTPPPPLPSVNHRHIREYPTLFPIGISFGIY